eukprot:6199585-Pleurochrysis_carterae.AAC.11
MFYPLVPRSDQHCAVLEPLSHAQSATVALLCAGASAGVRCECYALTPAETVARATLSVDVVAGCVSHGGAATASCAWVASL